MLMYPSPIDGYPIEWIEDLRRFQEKADLIRIEKKDVFSFISNPELIEFYKCADKLCELPSIEFHPPMPEEPWTWLFMIPKKQYEIRKLAPYVDKVYRAKQISEVLDIGGGVGFLAQTLNNQFGHHVTSIDMNAEFQKTGIDRHAKNAKHPHKVQFKNIKVENQGEFVEILKNNVMPVGLHTCGKLALDIIRVSADKKVPALINFGCCYHTLDKDPLQNLSAFARENDPIVMSKYALTLACRAHKKLDEKDFDLKQKVKYYRYAIHVLLYDEYDIKKLVILGNSNPKLYDESFGVYVYDQFKRVDIQPKHSIEELNTWFKNSELLILIDRMIAAGTIRNVLGRVLELYLQLDRAIFLEEQGYEVKVEEFFDEEISPRNIGITAILP